MKWILLLLLASALGGAAFLFVRDAGHDVAAIEVWHGLEQRTGHLGETQDDFNLMGEATANELWLRVNGGEARRLDIGDGPWGFRRLGASGHFNADIPIAALNVGNNALEVTAKGNKTSATANVTLRLEEGANPTLPFRIEWDDVARAQDVGQPVDGEWSIEGGGLRSEQPAYDRLFLIGGRDWRDYDIRTTATIASAPVETGPKSGAPGVGFIMRFGGHSVSPPRFPEAQPKWGYQPLGAILWLRFTTMSDEGERGAPIRQFYRGDKDASEDGASLADFETGRTYALRARCDTDAADPNATRYRFKAWPEGAEEPAEWDLDVTQTSEMAHRTGGVCLVAHHVDVTFGDVTVTSE